MWLRNSNLAIGHVRGAKHRHIFQERQLVLYGMFRCLYLVYRRMEGESPAEVYSMIVISWEL